MIDAKMFLEVSKHQELPFPPLVLVKLSHNLLLDYPGIA